MKIVSPLLIFLVCSSSYSWAQSSKLASLLERSPSPANSIGYVHLPSLTKLMEDDDISADLPDKVDEIWLVSDLDISQLHPRWEAGYATMTKDVSAKQLADA